MGEGRGTERRVRARQGVMSRLAGLVADLPLACLRPHARSQAAAAAQRAYDEDWGELAGAHAS